jgi:hypothetical protein
VTDLAASVRARLLGYARAQRLEFQSVLVRNGIERLLARLAGSPHADRFVLKGAQLLLARAAHAYRPTRDLDLLGFGSDDADDLVRVFREICGTTVEPDGLWFDASSVTGEVIRETATYEGVRVKLLATLERARIGRREPDGRATVGAISPRAATTPPRVSSLHRAHPGRSDLRPVPRRGWR